MPYQSRAQLPDRVRRILPEHAQDIYKAAFNSAWEEYKHSGNRRGEVSREETAHRVAWFAVKQKYQKGEDGQWHPKTEEQSGLDK